jgi:hypothetical protein
MTRFDTPGPISAVIEIGVGEVRISASERRDTVVDVRPSDDSRRADATAAEQTQVDFAAGRLVVRTARRWRAWSPFSDGGSIDLHVQLPSGSQLSGDAAMGAFRCEGVLGITRVKTGMGDIHVEHAAAASLTTGAGDIGLEHAGGDAQLSTGSGAVSVGEVEGSAVIKNSNGDTQAGAVAGDLQVKSANGAIAVERAGGSVSLKSANGAIRVGAAGRGSVVAESGFGAVEVGVAEGTAAWLDLSTGFGRIHNALDAAAPPGPGEDTVEVRARSGYGDITIRRAEAVEPAVTGG